ncbi:MAG TPA: excinuclease ABC subunit UvrC [Candidatus Saccharimonadales bacterium]|nr:excinuclease ABC subunit UvrC [Candidatus Saccharimonadales bacterium]
MSQPDKLVQKLKQLPKEPGVYFHKDAKGKIIYIGKAANLKNRVGSYFQQSRHRDAKTSLLVGDIVDLDWITVDSEVEALFLESEFIKRYRPKYNIDLKDDKHWIYIRIPMQDEFPVLEIVRRPLDDCVDYFGPYTSSDAVRKALKHLRKAFPYVTHSMTPPPPRACLHFHIGLCPGPEAGAITSADYKRSLRRLEMYFKGEKPKLVKQLEKEMAAAAKKQDFEAAAVRRNQLRNIQALSKQMIFGDKEVFDLSRDQALVGLADLLELKGLPRRIEAYDISHLQGTDNVASMIVFTDGVAHKEEYRRFKMRKGGNDDFEHMREVMRRRFSGKNLEQWPKPDLVLIDGGKGQLAAALGVMSELGVSLPTIGLAKREEEIIKLREEKTNNFEVVRLPHSSHILQLLQRVRDEAHRFAVTYHSLLRGKRQTASQLDDVPGIGPATRKKLIKQFGSVRGVKEASHDELSAAVGDVRARALQQFLGR